MWVYQVVHIVSTIFKTVFICLTIVDRVGVCRQHHSEVVYGMGGIVYMHHSYRLLMSIQQILRWSVELCIVTRGHTSIQQHLLITLYDIRGFQSGDIYYGTQFLTATPGITCNPKPFMTRASITGSSLTLLFHN